MKANTENATPAPTWNHRFACSPYSPLMVRPRSCAATRRNSMNSATLMASSSASPKPWKKVAKNAVALPPVSKRPAVRAWRTRTSRSSPESQGFSGRCTRLATSRLLRAEPALEERRRLLGELGRLLTKHAAEIRRRDTVSLDEGRHPLPECVRRLPGMIELPRALRSLRRTPGSGDQGRHPRERRRERAIAARRALRLRCPGKCRLDGRDGALDVFGRPSGARVPGAVFRGKSGRRRRQGRRGRRYGRR